MSSIIGTFPTTINNGQEVDAVPVMELFTFLQSQTNSNIGPGSDGSYLGYKQGSTNSISRTLQSKLKENVSVMDFGAKCDGVTDDTAAVILAINYCLSFNTVINNGQSPVPDLMVPGPCLISSTINIDRANGGMTGIFRIIGCGNNGGFVTTSAITLFSTSLTLSNLIAFEHLQFTGPATGTAYVISNLLIRILISHCYFRQMSLSYSNTTFMQSVYVRDCQIRETTGVWLTAAELDDVSIVGNLFEVCAQNIVVCTSGGSGMTSGFRFMDNLAENNQGNVITLISANGCLIAGNYLESNVGPFVTISGTSSGVDVSANYIYSSATNLANSSFYEVTPGSCQSFQGSANYSNGRLYKLVGPLFNADVGKSDYAALALINTFPVNNQYGELVTFAGSQNIENLSNQSFVKRDSRAISVNTNFMTIAPGTSCGTALIKLVCSGIQPGAGYTSIVNEWLCTQNGPGGAITITSVASQISGGGSLGWVTATASGNDINLTYVYAGTSAATFNSVVEVLVVSGDASSQIPIITMH